MKLSNIRAFRNLVSLGTRVFFSVSLGLVSNQVLAQSDEYKQAYSAYQTQNFSKADEIWRKLATEGDINAQYALGVMELRGETKNANSVSAFNWFKMAADKGHATAMFNVGVAYWEGSGVEKNRPEALKWWEQSAEAGDSGAQFNLGLAYYIGEEKTTNLPVAAKWISKAVKQNHPEAKKIYDILLTENPEIANLDLAAIQVSTKQSGETGAGNTQADTSDLSQIPVINKKETYFKTASDALIRTKPGSNGKIFSTLPQDTPVEVISSENNWLKVTLPSGIKTWVFENFILVYGKQGTIQGEGVRVRPHPSTDNENSPPIGAYKNGDSVTVLQKEGQWYQIRAPKHIGGWIPKTKLIEYQDTEVNRNQLWEIALSKGL